jgi:hypothetical protein
MTPMDINPYQPPTEVLPTRVEEANAPSSSAPRPLGIWILAVLHLLFGLLCLLLCALVVYAGLTGNDMISTTHSLGQTIAIFGGFMLVAVSSAIGLWRGDRWGWWLTAFYYVWGVLSVVAEFGMLLSPLNQQDPDFLGPPLPEKFIHAAIHAGILAYLFKGPVRDFFRLQSLKVHHALFPLTVVAIVVTVAMYVAFATIPRPSFYLN